MGKKILVTRSSLPPLEEYIEEIRDIFESHWLTNMGAKHEALTEELRKFSESGSSRSFKTGTGRSSLHCRHWSCAGK